MDRDRTAVDRSFPLQRKPPYPTRSHADAGSSVALLDQREEEL
jgi:hypothetical protein